MVWGWLRNDSDDSDDGEDDEDEGRYVLTYKERNVGEIQTVRYYLSCDEFFSATFADVETVGSSARFYNVDGSFVGELDRSRVVYSEVTERDEYAYWEEKERHFDEGWDAVSFSEDISSTDEKKLVGYEKR